MSEKSEEEIFGKPATLLEAPCGCSLLAGAGSTSHTYCPRDAALRTPTSYVRQVNEAPDSLAFGTPGGEGEIKVYGNANDLPAMRAKLNAMLELRAEAPTPAKMKKAQP